MVSHGLLILYYVRQASNRFENIGRMYKFERYHQLGLADLISQQD